jgi:transcriptional regulator with XRE-family HTH domain
MSYPERTRFVDESSTASSTATIIPFPPPRPTFASIAVEAAALRDEVGVTTTRVEDVHRGAQLGALDERTSLVALRDPVELLAELAEAHGLSWTTIAKLVGVTDAAVRKWRRGEAISSENRRVLARAVGLLEMLTDLAVGEPASWLEMRISEDSTVTPVELFAADRADLMFELAGRRRSPHQVLDEFEPGWRHRLGRDDNFDVVTGPDGHPIIVERRTND